MVKKTILIFILFFFVHGLMSGDYDNNKNTKKISLAKFIPGIYQIKKRKIIKGGILLGAFLTTIASAIVENNRGNDYYQQYLDSVVIEEIVELRKKAEHSYRMRNYYIAGIFTVWVIHLVDIKFFSKKKSGLKSEIKNNRFCINLYYSF